MPNSEKTTAIINSHTHIFTGDHVPPFLAKTFIWFPFYYLFHTPTIIWVLRSYYRLKGKYYEYSIFKNIERFRNWLAQFKLLTYLRYLVNAYLSVNVLFILYDWFAKWLSPSKDYDTYLNQFKAFLEKYNLLLGIENLLLNIAIIVFFFLFFKSGRNLILFILKRVFSIFKLMPGEMTKSLFERYVLMGRFATYGTQGRILSNLIAQYPPESLFVVLPMDMEYMNAGKPKESYEKQMDKLVSIKEKSTNRGQIIPFVFVDPRRISDSKIYKVSDQDFTFFDYSIKVESGEKRVSLEEGTLIKKYIEENQFGGFKIYPALGYYPFDEKLLPIWKYAADNGIPIMTHCIKGTIFYRGQKKGAWNKHPILQEQRRNGKLEPLPLLQRKNKDFSINFTHPLNYLCLLKEEFLRKIIGQSEDSKLKELFGYKDGETALESNLSNLKICFGHFGGEDQWNNFFEADRSPYSQQIIKNPSWGIDFMKNTKGVFSPDKLYKIWNSTDWYSIICSLMLQHENIYADVSYILYDPKIQALLKETLNNPILRERVLFGTDFYVVRNHRSDKELKALLASMLTALEFEVISRSNPKSFLEWANTNRQLASF